MASAAFTAIGLDLGAQKTMIVADDGEIIRTSTGSIAHPTMVSFAGKKRLFGEEALAQASSESTIALVNLLVGRSYEELQSLSTLSGRKLNFSKDDAGRVFVEITFRDETEKFPLSGILGMFLSHVSGPINDVAHPEATYCFALPPNYSKALEKSYREACAVAGIAESRVFIADGADCLVAAYARKVAGLGGPDKANLQNKKVLLLDMGHAQTTAVVVQYDADTESGPRKLAVQFDGELGAYHFDLKLFDHFNDICSKKHGSKAEMTSKRGNRLLSGCERIRKLLSQLNESSITVENLVDSGDVHFSLRRDEMMTICATLLDRLRTLLARVVADATGGEGAIDAIEVVGGGMRMPIIQSLLLQIVGDDKALGAKLDDGALSVGAALLFKQQQQQAQAEQPTATETPEDIAAFSAEELAVFRAKELALQEHDNNIRRFQEAYNRLESFILEMRNAPRQKFGNTIDTAKLNPLLDDAEGWMWDNADTASIEEFLAKETSLKEEVTTLCAAYFTAQEAERKRVEEALQEEAARAAAERAANGEEDEDHDNRKLRKADRMRLVVKNKDEGTELFKGGNYRPAAARYQKALTHAAKFFDLTPEDENEVKALRLALYCNLASCYIKLENWEQVERNCNDALKLDAKCVKALFRRGSFYEQKKEWELALTDYRTCAEINDTEDKLVTKAMERVRKEIQKLKDKEKKMWGKAFA